MPPWLPKAVALVLCAVAALVAGWWLFVQLQGLLVLILVSLFLALALEPAVNWLHQHGVPRGPATAALMLGGTAATLAFFSILGSMLVGQVLALVGELPEMTGAVLNWINSTFRTRISPTGLLTEVSSASGLIQSYANSVLENVWGAGTTLLIGLFNGLTIALFTFYLCADGPRFRRTICSVLPPRTQAEVLRAWEIAIRKTGGFIYSRALLATACTAAHYVVLILLDIDYAFALALWIGVLSQFIPTVGTYIGGALPVLVALLQGPWPTLWILLFITVYQQFENYLLQPRITALTLDMHPAVAFGSVIAGAAILGPPGALLALPAGASMQAFASSYIRRYEVTEHPLVSPEAEAPADDAPPEDPPEPSSPDTAEPGAAPPAGPGARAAGDPEPAGDGA
ncbi:AI-2E family transporter [Murinocardiopsis flavida]|nr:AI-2E family transporter [Murinocardiopsis flavida]